MTRPFQGVVRPRPGGGDRRPADHEPRHGNGKPRPGIELTQTQITTLGKDPEGEEVLFFFDIERWVNYRKGDLSVPQRHFQDYLSFIDDTPIDLKPLLDPNAAVDRKTYDRFGDE